MNNTYINFHLYGLNVYLTYVYISTHQVKLSALSVAIRLDSSFLSKEGRQ